VTTSEYLLLYDFLFCFFWFADISVRFLTQTPLLGKSPPFQKSLSLSSSYNGNGLCRGEILQVGMEHLTLASLGEVKGGTRSPSTLTTSPW
jgi:hypothetical protein